VLRLVGREGDVAVLVDHHTAKPPLAGSETWAGSQFAGRGASAIPAAARCVVTLYAASADDCLELGVAMSERGNFVRLDTGKQSYAKVGGTKWLRWQTVQLHNGDEVGVLVPYDERGGVQAAAAPIADVLIAAVQRAGSASLPLDRVIEVLMRDPLLAKEGKATVRNRLERVLADPVRRGGVEIALLRGVRGLEGVVIR